MKKKNDRTPLWLEGKTVNEVLFCQEFLAEHPMVNVGNAFFTKDGIGPDENMMKKLIYEELKPYVRTDLPKTVATLLAVIRMESCIEQLPAEDNLIHCANGTLNLEDGSFTEEKNFCRCRLPVAYHPEAPVPEKWLTFLSQLFYPEDIPSVQEFFGYCLIPSTKAHKMMLVTGRGGEGKSRLGIVLQALLGNNMKTGSLHKVETSPFARADLQNVLVMVDDDMKMEALKATNNIKAIVTAELPMDLEKKGIQSYQANLWVRFMAFGNDTLQALYDRSPGFFRRQLILEAKEQDPNRKNDPYLAEKLCTEKEGILLWALEGLYRLIRNNFAISESERAKENRLAAMADGHNLVDFMASEGYFHFKADSEVSSRDFYAVYMTWCEDNALHPLAQKAFSSFLKNNESTYNLEYSNKVTNREGKKVRGFMGIELNNFPIVM